MVENDPQFVRGLLLVANVLTVLEPVNLKELREELEESISEKDLRRVLRFLKKERLIRRLGDGRYISTPKGLRIASGSPLGRRRDIERMFRILDGNKEGRTGAFGLGDEPSPLMQEDE